MPDARLADGRLKPLILIFRTSQRSGDPAFALAMFAGEYTEGNFRHVI